MNDGIKFRMCSGSWNERRLEREAKLRLARMLGMKIMEIPRQEIMLLTDEEIKVKFSGEEGVK